MADVNVVLNMQPGTGKDGNNPPANNNNQNWVRTMSKGSDNKWDVPSRWWFYYSGGNGPNKNNGGIEGGEVDLPSGGSFMVSPSGNEVISSVIINETATTFPPGETSYYSPNPPTKDANGSSFTIRDAEHTDPSGKEDSFDVYAQFNSQGTLVKCDPFIRNK